jgi:uncharacterized surface protein with fasciclin (FAS1) repeats
MAQPNDRAASGEVVRAVPAAFAPPPSPTREVHTMRRTLTATLAAAALAASTVLPAAAAPAPAPGSDPIATIAVDNGFTELVSALVYVDEKLGTDLVDTFSEGTDQYTVFAPTDEAFEDLYGLLSVVLEADIDEIRDVPAPVVLDVLLYHVAEGRRAANSVVPRRGERTITPLLGETFSVRGDLTIADGLSGLGLRPDAALQPPLVNVSASNGIVHVIDQVIVPPSVVAALTS